jgi:hypothetical protein
MDFENQTMSHYSVVRFYSDFSIGLVQEVVDADLTLDAAQELARHESAKAVPGEDIIVLDQDKIGSDAEVMAFRAAPLKVDDEPGARV